MTAVEKAYEVVHDYVSARDRLNRARARLKQLAKAGGADAADDEFQRLRDNLPGILDSHQQAHDRYTLQLPDILHAILEELVELGEARQ